MPTAIKIKQFLLGSMDICMYVCKSYVGGGGEREHVRALVDV